MAEMFLTIDETMAQLNNLGQRELEQLCREGRLDKVWDGRRSMFNADQVERLAGEMRNAALPPVPVAIVEPAADDDDWDLFGFQEDDDSLDLAPEKLASVHIQAALRATGGEVEIIKGARLVLDGEDVVLSWAFGRGSLIEVALSDDFLGMNSLHELQERLQRSLAGIDPALVAAPGGCLASGFARELLMSSRVTELRCDGVIKNLGLPPIQLDQRARVSLRLENCTAGFSLFIPEDHHVSSTPCFERLEVSGASDVHIECQAAQFDCLRVSGESALSGDLIGCRINAASSRMEGRLTGLDLRCIKVLGPNGENEITSVFAGARVTYELCDDDLRRRTRRLTDHENRADIERLNALRSNKRMEDHLAQALDAFIPGKQVMHGGVRETPLSKEGAEDLRKAALEIVRDMGQEGNEIKSVVENAVLVLIPLDGTPMRRLENAIVAFIPADNQQQSFVVHVGNGAAPVQVRSREIGGATWLRGARMWWEEGQASKPLLRSEIVATVYTSRFQRRPRRPAPFLPEIESGVAIFSDEEVR